MKLEPVSPEVDGPIRLGISACLLGKEVRYDGGHKLDRYLRDTLGRYVEYFHFRVLLEFFFLWQYFGQLFFIRY